MTLDHDSKALSQARFGRFANGYVTSRTHAKGAELDRLVEIARPQPDWLMLDIATGGGHTALKFAPHVRWVVASDISPAMLDAARAFSGKKGVGNVTYQLSDAEELPFEGSQFDLVTCRLAPHHFPDCPRFVHESARVLKAGGLLLVQDHVLPEDERTARYVDDFERIRDPSHNRAYSESEWVGILNAVGLDVEHREQVTKRHVFLRWVELQRCPSPVVEDLQGRLAQATDQAAEWMQPRDTGTPMATFANHHIIIAGRKQECK
jgi:ubiquinone/menaquinone biosynthesis C-methylase UbiE